MKVGDLVKLDKRFNRLDERSEAQLCNKQNNIYLILRRDAQSMYKKYNDDSQWAAWHIMHIETGKIHNQIARDLEVISESW